MFDHGLLGLLDVEPFDRGVGNGVDAVRCFGQDATVATDDRTHVEVQFSPPDHVGGVTERADHGDPGALVGLCQLVGQHGDFDAVQRGENGAAEQRLVADVVGVRDERHAGSQQLRAGGVDQHVAGSVGLVEGDLVVGGGPVAILHLGLGDGGLEVDVPHRGGVMAVRLISGEVAQEGTLADAAAALVDRGVQQIPVDAQPEPAEQTFEHLLVDLDQLVAQLQEVRPRDRDGVMVLRWLAPERRLEVGLVRLARVAPHAVVVLHAPFGRQPVVVPTHRVEHRLATHPLEAGDRVGVGVAEHVAHVQRTRHRRRWCVDREHVGAYRRRVEAVDVIEIPLGSPAFLDAVERRPIRDVRHSPTRLREPDGGRPAAFIANVRASTSGATGTGAGRRCIRCAPPWARGR